MSQAGETQCVRASRSQVDNPPANEWSAIINADHNRPAVARIGDADACTKRQSLMGGCQTGPAQMFTISRPAAFPID